MSAVDTASDNVMVHAATPLADRPPMQVPEGAVPSWVDYPALVADLADDGVAAPEPYADGLRAVVADAASHGLTLKIVYTEAPAAVYTQARDLAAHLAATCEDCTVFVRTPVFVGSVSDTIPRARLEAGQDDAFRETDPVAAAVVFENKILQPGPSWGALTAAAIVALVLVVAAVAYLIRRRQH